MRGVRVIDSADVSDDSSIGPGTSIWHLAQVRERAVIGANCVVGRGAYIGAGVRIGSNVKIQNFALVYEQAVIGDGAFVGPGAVLTNDEHPRSVNPDGSPKSATDWAPVGVTLREGASLGAGTVCVAPVIVGRWAMVAAGATVVDDVPDFALAVGTPARRIGWVGRTGVSLQPDGETGLWRCPATGARYLQLSSDVLEEC